MNVTEKMVQKQWLFIYGTLSANCGIYESQTD